MTHDFRPHLLLLHPPVVKPSEPPAGVARLAGALRCHGVSCTVIDMNLEGLFNLMHAPQTATDRWTRRALRSLPKNLEAISSRFLYRNFDRYRRSVVDLNRVFEQSSPSSQVHLSLTNYQHRELSPVSSRDLLRAAEVPEENPFFPYFQQRLASVMADESPTIVGISLNYLSQALCAFALLGLLRREFPHLTLILGGGLVTSWLRRPAWANPFTGLVDHLVAGAGELALLSLAGIQHVVQRHFLPSFDFVSFPCRDAEVPRHRQADAERGSLGCGEAVRGREGDGETRSSGGRGARERRSGASGVRGEAEDSSCQNSSLFTLHPSPFTPCSPYLAPGFILPYSASSGCYWNRCEFCPERAEGTPYRPIPVDQVVKELHHLVHATNPILIHLLDNALSPKLMAALVANPPSVPWYGFARITDHLVDGGFCRALRRSGCVMLQLGIESGDQGVLDSESKGIDLRIAAQALKNLTTAGIATYVYLLFGTPTETLREARKTLEFAVQHAEEIGFLNLAIFNLPIYGPRTGILKARPHSEGDLSLYVNFDHPKGWHRAKVRQFLDKEFKRHPAVASIIRRDPPFFTSNHAPFFAQRGWNEG